MNKDKLKEMLKEMSKEELLEVIVEMQSEDSSDTVHSIDKTKPKKRRGKGRRRDLAATQRHHGSVPRPRREVSTHRSHKSRRQSPRESRRRHIH